MQTIAIASQIILLLYHQATTLIDFFPFNGVRFYSRRETFAEAAANFVPMGLAAGGFIFRIGGLMKFGVIYYCVLFLIECATWWAPYFLGPSPKAAEYYNRIHRQTITVIPRRGDNPAPNLEHLILMALTLVTAILSLLAFHSMPLYQWCIGFAIGAFMISGATFQTCFQNRPKSPSHNFKM